MARRLLKRGAAIREIRAWESRYLDMLTECPIRWPKYAEEDTDENR